MEKRPRFEADCLLYSVPILRVSVPQTPLSPVPSSTLHMPLMRAWGGAVFKALRY
jgi:hypothetical protein